MRFTLLFWFILSEVSEVGLPGLVMPRMRASALPWCHTQGLTTLGSHQTPRACCDLISWGFTPSPSPVCVVISTQLAMLHQIKISGALSEFLRFSNLYSQIACLEITRV